MATRARLTVVVLTALLAGGSFAQITAPLTYTILTLPASGALFDGNTAILQAPYTLSASRVTYQPPQNFVGNTSFEFSVSNGFAVDQAIVSIHVVLPDCASDPLACDDGR